MTRPWLWALAGPTLFLAMIVLMSGVLAALGHAPEAIPVLVAARASTILLAVLAVLGGLALRFVDWRELWRQGGGGVGLGVAVGAGIAALYLVVLAPALTLLQTRLGDYVPPGEVLATVSGNLWLFFIANVLLAPVVEETIYRGHLLRGWTLRHGLARGVVLTCVAFGALHWTGGLWYMLLTGLVAGGPLAWLALRRGGLAAPFAAHLTLNLIEFGAAALL